jgi:glycosyltransferase involved in cell wall biosynthesis
MVWCYPSALSNLRHPFSIHCPFSRKPLKIAILSTISGYSWAGTEEVWYQLAKLALSRGHQVMVAADHQVISSEPCSQLVAIGLKTSARHCFRPQRIHALKNKIRDDHREVLVFAPDILLINAGSPFDLSYNNILKLFVDKLSCKKVFFCHFNSDRLNVHGCDATRRMLMTMDHLVFVCDANLRMLEIQLATRFKNITIVHNASKFNLPNPLPYPSSDFIRFANIARLETAWKGQDILVALLSETPWNDRLVTISMFGVGPDEAYILELINMFQTQEQIHLKGYIKKIDDVWKNHHILLLPSRGEGAPLAAIEAMMCGRPVIATDVGGNREIIQDGVSGFIAEAPTLHSFAGAMERAWSQRHRWEQMGRAAHARAKELTFADPSGQLLTMLETIGSNQPIT